MAHITADRVRDTTTSTGTGALNVSGSAPNGYRTFSDVASTSDTFYYAVQHQAASEWEVGLGTYSAANQITRTTVYSSSNSGSAVNFSAGTKDIFITLAASRTVQRDNTGNISGLVIGTNVQAWDADLDTWATKTAPSGTVVGTTDTQTLSAKTITGLRETRTAPTISSGTLTLDCSAGNVFNVALNANITTLSFTNVPSSGTAFALTLLLTADGTARTVTWGASVKWPGGTAPTLTSTNGKVDAFVLFTHDGGTNWLAFTGGQNS